MSILNLISEFQNNKIGRKELERTLLQYLQLCERKQQELPELSLPLEDQARWQEELLPALKNSYSALAGAANTALNYTQKPSEQLISGMIGRVQEVYRIQAFVEQRACFVSPETRSLLQQAMNFDSDQLAYLTPFVRTEPASLTLN